MRVLVNRSALPTLVRGYAASVQHTGPVPLGRAALRAGDNTLVVEIVGKDARASGYSDGYLVGIDAFELRRLPNR